MTHLTKLFSDSWVSGHAVIEQATPARSRNLGKCKTVQLDIERLTGRWLSFQLFLLGQAVEDAEAILDGWIESERRLWGATVEALSIGATFHPRLAVVVLSRCQGASTCRAGG